MKDVKVTSNMMRDHLPICKIIFFTQKNATIKFFWSFNSMAVHKQCPRNTFISFNIHKYYNIRVYLTSSGLGTVVSGNWMASTGTVIPYLFMPCCRRDRTDSLMNEGVGLTHEPVNSFVASKTASTTTQHSVRDVEPTFSQSFAFLFWVQWNSSLFKTKSFQILWQFSPNSPDFKKPLHSHIVKMQVFWHHCDI